MIQLRPYQQEAIAATAAAYQRGIRRACISLPTGTGKTVVFSTIARGAVQKGRRPLILAHRDELLSQAKEKLLTTAPELRGRVGLIKAERNEYNHVTIASVQSLHSKRLARLLSTLDSLGERWNPIIVDEAHHTAAASYQRILEALGCMEEGTDLLTIGVTATPQRSDNKDLGETWEEIVYHKDILSMMRDGYLCDLRGIQVQLAALDMNSVRVSRGDFVESEVAERMLEADAPRHVFRAWRVHAEGRKTLIFTPTIQLAREMAMQFRDNGVRAVHLSGETPLDERRQMLADFSAGKIQVIANAQVLTEGFDEPTVDCIVIARPTKSQVLYSQMIGRGTRPYPGKADCLVLDTVGATERLDLLTVPKLFGLGEEAEEAEGKGEPEQTVLALAGMREERQVREGRIVARQVELFDRQKLAWTLARPGMWVLGLDGEQLILQVDGASNTWAFYTQEGRSSRVLRQYALDLGYAMGAAEDYARRSPNFASRLVSKDAGWRMGPASDGQITALKKFGLPWEGLTKGEASDQITAAIARARSRA